MAYNILSVSILEDSIDILRLELGVTNTYTAVGESQRNVDQETLAQAAKWADEIRVNADFPTAEYQWNAFPKVSNRILKQLVTRQALQVLETRQGGRVAFHDQGTTIIDGLVKRRVSYMAVHEEEVSTLEQKLFAGHRKKIVRVTSLPVALCSAVVQSEQPKKDFMVVWVGEMSTIFVISSPHGDVKIARNVPVGINRNDTENDDPEVMQSFSQEFDRDIMNTLLLYNDTFEEPSCEKFYLLGNTKLENVFAEYELESVGENEVFSLENLPVRALNENDICAYHLLGNLWSDHKYNLVDPAIIREQRFDRGYKYATMILIGCIVATGAWMLVTTPPGDAGNSTLYAEKTRQLEEINQRLYQLQSREIELKRFSGWKKFYKNTYTNQPAWSRMFSSLAQDIPEEFVINSLRITPAQNTGFYGWTCLLEGRIKCSQWNMGLALLREFGIKVHRSPYFDVVDVQYTPLEDSKNAGSEESSFDFVMKMNLTPQDKKQDAR